MERTFTHKITYTNSTTVPVADVAASLIANEQLVKEAAQLLEVLFPNITIDKIEVSFRSATTSSPLKEIMIGAIFLALQDDLERDVPAILDRIPGVHVPEDMRSVVTILVVAVAIYGIAKAYELFGPKKKKADAQDAAPTIQGNYNRVLNITGDVIGLEPEQIAAAIERKYQGRQGRSLARKALGFIRPAKREAGAAVEGGGGRIDPETVAAAPALSDAPDDKEIQEPLTAQTVDIHATDRDSNKSGWAGVLPEVSQKRLRMLLYPTIDPDEVFGEREITADVILVSKRDDAGEYNPYLFHVVRVY